MNYSFNIHANTESHKLIQPTTGTWLIIAYVCGRDAGGRQADGNKKAGGGTEHAYSTDERVCVRHSVSQLLRYPGAQKNSNDPCHHCDSSKDVTFTRERRNSVVINFSLRFSLNLPDQSDWSNSWILSTQFGEMTAEHNKQIYWQDCKGKNSCTQSMSYLTKEQANMNTITEEVSAV